MGNDAEVSGGDAATVEAVLRNLDLATKVFNANLEQQNALAHQQAMAHLRMAATAKCVELILGIDPTDPNAGDLLRQYKELMDLFDEKLR